MTVMTLEVIYVTRHGVSAVTLSARILSRRLFVSLLFCSPVNPQGQGERQTKRGKGRTHG